MTSALHHAVTEAARGDGPETIALMRVLGEAATAQDAHRALADALTRCIAGADVTAAARLDRLRQLWAAHPNAWDVVRGTLAEIAHDRPADERDDTLRYWADAFDRLAAASPEASVALYSLGSPDLLAAATAEIVAFMDRLGLLGPGRDALDMGCGIGRFLVALAPRLRSLVGLDISAGMVAEARRRCAGLPNVRVAQSAGRDLDASLDASLDLVLAADVFPYLVQAGGTLAERHILAFGRILRPGGAALILNYAYGQDRAADERAVGAAASAGGLVLDRVGADEFVTWDGVSYLLRRPG